MESKIAPSKPSKVKLRRTRDDDVFKVAFRVASSIADDSVRLVHGSPWSMKWKKRVLHAWVEMKDVSLVTPDGKMTRETYVIDPYMIMPTTVGKMTQKEFYKLARLEFQTTKRYTKAEAVTNFMRTGHTGPWKDAKWGARRALPQVLDTHLNPVKVNRDYQVTKYKDAEKEALKKLRTYARKH